MEDLDEIQQFRQGLFHDLRTELGHLKGCQTSLLIFSSAAAGLFLSLLRDDTYLHPAYLLLLPLIFLLPLWLIFYEKARSVARIVGFVRVQEALYECDSLSGHIGWESAMKKYWQRRKVWDDRKLDGEFALDKKRSATTSVYWFAVFITFFSFTSLCLIGGLYFLPVQVAVKYAIVLAFAITFFMSFDILYLHKIGKPKNQSKNEAETAVTHPHTNMKEFGRRALLVVLCFVIFIIIIFSLGVLVSAIVVPALLMDCVLRSVPLFVYLGFLSAAIFSASMAAWMFLNLVKSRYSYDLFEVRWQIILDIKINRDTRTVLDVNWEKRLQQLKSKSRMSSGKRGCRRWSRRHAIRRLLSTGRLWRTHRQSRTGMGTDRIDNPV